MKAAIWDVELLVTVTGGKRVWASTYAEHKYRTEAEAAVAKYEAQGIKARVKLKYAS
jgi:hypothetical protein